MIWTFLIVCSGLMSAYEAIHPRQLTELRDAGNYEEFARMLGIEDVDLVRPSENDERSEVIDMRTRPVSPLGDILLPKEQMEEGEQARTHINFTRYPGSKWPNCSMYYWIVESDFAEGQVDIIKNAIEDFNKKSPFVKCLPYPETMPCDDYVYFFNSSGCWSYLGRRGGAQPISLQWNGCVVKRIILHEIMHALGVHHEQTRCDRDKYIEMKYENIPEKWHAQYDKTDCDVFLTPPPYDYYSIMHYRIRAPESDKPAFSVKQDGIDEDRIGHSPCLTDYDWEKLNNAYRDCDKV